MTAPDQRQLDPQAQLVLDRVRDSGIPPYESLDPATARRYYEKACESGRGLPPEPAEIRDLLIPGQGGPLALRLYRAQNALELPALVFYHGGGFTIGSLETHDAVCRYLCVGADCAVIAVDYRLAPEHRFPAAQEDAFQALLWVAENADTLGIDSRRIAVGGDSAGGNLAAVTCLAARAAGGPEIAFQLLIYPGTDMTESFPSHKTYGEGYLLTSTLIGWFHGNYLPVGVDPRDWRASPLHATDHSGLPAAHVITAGFDPLQDEGLAYAEKLRAAGVAVSFHQYPGMLHGFITQPRFVDVARTALDDFSRRLRLAFGNAQDGI